MIGVVTGLTAEARMARRLGVARAGGGTPAGAADAAVALVKGGAHVLISFGLAGGLRAGLAPGTLVVPSHVMTAEAIYPADPLLVRALGGPAYSLYAGTAVVVTAAEKASLFAQTGADAIDLESGAVAQVAAAHNLPFAVLRAICDPADSTLPHAAIIALDGRGAIALAQISGAVLRDPTQVPILLRLATHAAAARGALRRHVSQIGQIMPIAYETDR